MTDTPHSPAPQAPNEGGYRPLPARDRDRPPPAGHGRRAAADLGRLSPLRRSSDQRRIGVVPDAAQPVEPVGADLDRSASWRPAWCWSSSPATSTCRSARSWAWSAWYMGLLQVEWLPPVPGPWPSGDLDHHGDLRHRAGRADRRVPGLADRLSAASRPSSSRWAACWSGAARPFWWRDGETIAPLDSNLRPDRRWALWRRSARREAGSSACWAVRASCGCCWTVAASARKHGFPLRPVWAEVTVWRYWAAA